MEGIAARAPVDVCQNGQLMSENPTILVIDDETGSRESMALALEKTGIGVKTFDDALPTLGEPDRKLRIRHHPLSLALNSSI